MIPSSQSFRYSTNLFLRVLGAIYLIGIYSFWLQAEGLIGSKGISPVSEFLPLAQSQMGSAAWWNFPTIFWLNSSDTMIHGACIVGMVAGIFLILGWMPLLNTVLLWIIYLSLAVAGQIFMGYQWDNLLLEAGFLAILVSPPVLRSRAHRNPLPSKLIIFLFFWLLFRLMFSSGYAKLASNDPSWRDFTAWYYHYAPAWFLKMSALLMFVIELGVPFLIFISRYARMAAFVLLVLLQLLISATGNYGFFNLLSIGLCLFLLDDYWFENAKTRPPLELAESKLYLLRALRAPMAILILLVSSVFMTSMIKPDIAWPKPLLGFVSAVAPFRSVNQYGLFASMTKSRPEIVIEGSRDGRNWVPYEFPYKPGNVHQTPLFVAPHMPRLDWQMWFAALQTYDRNPWLISLMNRLLEGQPEVVDLLGVNPFAGDPPVYVRALLYEYRFANPQQHKADQRWWERELKGLYCPVLSRATP